MNENRIADEICRVLLRAQDNLVITLEVRGATESIRMNALPASFRGPFGDELARRLVNDGAWDTDAPAFQAVREWVESNWNTERVTKVPTGTIGTTDFGSRSETQFDAVTATRKLILSAALHGAQAAATYASEFACHGMIEIRSIYLLKGPSISEPKPLDDYCCLLPYRDALRRVDPSHRFQTNPWPSEGKDNVCALECTSFERRTLNGIENESFGSPLLRLGPETLTLMLGLVWGNGLRVFGSWCGTPAPVAATLPFPSWTLLGSGKSIDRIELSFQGWGPKSRQRPLAIAELAELMERYADLPDRSQRRLAVALRRLRYSTERVESEDRVIDMGIALEALFVDEGEYRNQRKIIARRGSWYFADSPQERERTRSSLKEFYDLRSKVVHGNADVLKKHREEVGQRSPIADLIAAVSEVIRAGLKDMIAEGRPEDWEKSKNGASIRHNPPRRNSEVRSDKSDSMSWTVAEQKEIDSALESAWKSTIENAPAPPSNTGVVIHYGLNPETVEECRRQGGHYVITHPAILYKVHPQWPKAASDPLDERTEYYCQKDVERHMQLWREAATEKRLSQFHLPCDAATYHPKNETAWARPLR